MPCCNGYIWPENYLFINKHNFTRNVFDFTRNVFIYVELHAYNSYIELHTYNSCESLSYLPNMWQLLKSNVRRLWKPRSIRDSSEMFTIWGLEQRGYGFILNHHWVKDLGWPFYPIWSNVDRSFYPIWMNPVWRMGNS